MKFSIESWFRSGSQWSKRTSPRNLGRTPEQGVAWSTQGWWGILTTASGLACGSEVAQSSRQMLPSLKTTSSTCSWCFQWGKFALFQGTSFGLWSWWLSSTSLSKASTSQSNIWMGRLIWLRLSLKTLKTSSSIQATSETSFLTKCLSLWFLVFWQTSYSWIGLRKEMSLSCRMTGTTKRISWMELRSQSINLHWIRLQRP